MRARAHRRLRQNTNGRRSGQCRCSGIRGGLPACRSRAEAWTSRRRRAFNKRSSESRHVPPPPRNSSPQEQRALLEYTIQRVAKEARRAWLGRPWRWPARCVRCRRLNDASSQSIRSVVDDVDVTRVSRAEAEELFGESDRDLPSRPSPGAASAARRATAAVVSADPVGSSDCVSGMHGRPQRVTGRRLMRRALRSPGSSSCSRTTSMSPSMSLEAEPAREREAPRRRSRRARRRRTSPSSSTTRSPERTRRRRRRVCIPPHSARADSAATARAAEPGDVVTIASRSRRARRGRSSRTASRARAT